MAPASLQVLAVAAALGRLSWAEDAVKPDFGFGEEVAKHFVMPPSPVHVHEVAAETGKPAMVILMTKASPHCGVLRKVIKSASKSSKFKTSLDSFTVAYAEENIKLWTESGATYVPQVLFFAPGGERLPVYSNNKKYQYYYQEQAALEKSMLQALELAKEQGSCVGGPQCRGIDDNDMCEMTTGCKWGAASPSDAPCQGGAQCDGIDEKDMCEFTDGCTWESEQDDVGGLAGDAPAAGGGGDSGHAQKPLFDPAHSFSVDIADKILDNLAPNAMRQAAAKEKKPYMVLLTQPWCDACKELINSINSGNKVKKLLDSFVTMHAYGDSGITNWQAPGEQYVPQAYFFNADGSSLQVTGRNKQFKHFFSFESDLADAMHSALGEAGGGEEL